MIWAIVKLSYKKIWNNDLVWGICGTAFSIDKETALTANHVLNKSTFAPNEGYNFCEVFLCVEPNIIIKIEESDLNYFPGIDTTEINLENQISLPAYKVSKAKITDNEKVFNIWFIGAKMPQHIDFIWKKSWLDLKFIIFGNVKTYWRWEIINHIMNINWNDVKLKNIPWYITSFPWIVWMSWWPLINERNNKIIWLMSMWLPTDVQIKTNLFAVSIKEILKRINH